MCFAKTRDLDRHKARKRPCALKTDCPQDVPNKCKHCGRSYSRPDNLARHLKTCAIANVSDTSAEIDKLRHQLAAHQAEIKELRQSVQQMSVTRVADAPPLAVQNVANQTNNNTVNVTVNIVPWDSAGRTNITANHIVQAFAQNALVQEYAGQSNDDLTDPDRAPPYVAELMMDILRRYHADPAARNIYLNPSRQDQVLVHMTTGRWEVLPLKESSRLLLDGVAAAIHSVNMQDQDRKKLPMDAQNALAMAGMMYAGEPDMYVHRVKQPMVAHLANNSPL